MFFIEPLTWMFKTPNFKQHFLRLIGFSFLCWVLLSVLLLIMNNLSVGAGLISSIIAVIAAIILIIVPGLLITGYFWCLTDNIIDRGLDADINSIYNGRNAKFKNVITLPDWDIKKILWRGVASVVATIILCTPFIELIILFVINQTVITDFWNIDTQFVSIILCVVLLLSVILIPALLWNYARRDSIVAVLNFPKAIYIIATYTGKYLGNAFLFIFYSIIQLFVFIGISLLFGTSITEPSQISNCASCLTSLGDGLEIKAVIANIIFFIICVYRLFVDAYLLGTIAPPSEY